MTSLFEFTHLTKHRRDDAAVEFAILMPVMMMAIFGIVVIGSYVAVIHGLQQLAAEAARASVAGLDHAARTSIATAYVTSNVGTYPLIDAAHVTVTAATPSSSSQIFVVTVSYDASHMLLSALPMFAPPSVISRSAAISIGGL